MSSIDINRPTCTHLALVSQHLDPERIPRAAAWYEMSASSEFATKGNVGFKSTSDFETILKAGKRDSANCDCERAEEQQVEPATAPQDADDSMATVIQKVIVDEVKQQFQNKFAVIMKLFEKAAEQLLHAAALRSQSHVCTAM